MAPHSESASLEVYRWSKETWGLEDEEGGTTTNTVDAGEGGDEIIGALVVVTLALSKGVAMVDVDAVTALAEVAGISTPAVGVTSRTGMTRRGEE